MEVVFGLGKTVNVYIIEMYVESVVGGAVVVQVRLE